MEWVFLALVLVVVAVLGAITDRAECYECGSYYSRSAASRERRELGLCRRCYDVHVLGRGVFCLGLLVALVILAVILGLLKDGFGKGPGARIRPPSAFEAPEDVELDRLLRDDAQRAAEEAKARASAKARAKARGEGKIWRSDGGRPPAVKARGEGWRSDDPRDVRETDR